MIAKNCERGWIKAEELCVQGISSADQNAGKIGKIG
jgi:hypothetical protein